MNSGGLTGQTTIGAVDWNPIVCLGSAFSIPGLKSIGILLLTGVGITAYVRFHDKFSSKDYDERGFTRSKYGTYGTASWMKDKELKEILEIKPPSQADGIILGEKNGSVVCLPKDTRLNRHIAVFGASGTRKSRGVIRPALFTILKRGESAVITDPKAELYNDTAELFRKNGYEVKVFNLVDPRHGDSWNCMSDLNGDTLLAQVLTNVIISNTSEGKGDHFWDNGEANLLKALVLYIDLDRSRSPETKNLAAAYRLLTQNSERQLTALFEKLPLDHPARAPFNLFSQASDTVRSGIVLGLGTRLQVLQNEAVRDIISRSDIDLTAPGKRKCAYFVILYDFCKALHIPVTVYGHSTSGNSVELYSYAEFESIDSDDKYRMMDIAARGSNRDGAALRFVAEQLVKRPEEVKILILVSDGQPAAPGYYGSAAEEDLRGIRQEYRRKGVLFIAAAIGEDKQNIERIYGDSFMDITDLNQLPVKLTAAVKRHMRV